MKTEIYLFIIIFSLAACKSGKKMTAQPDYTTVAETVTVKEEVQDTLILPVKQEEVKLTHGDDLMSCCIIVGSFVNESNAVRLRSELLENGFNYSCIMRNKEGMYRVSPVCFDNETQALNELYKIRNNWPSFQDAWLLRVKN